MNQDFKRLDAEFEQFLFSVLHEVQETELTPDKKRERRKLADVSAFDFCRIYYPNIFDSDFNDIHRHINSLVKGNHTVSGFRKSGKTAFTIISKVVKRIVDGRGGIINICLRTQDIARERTFHIFRLITQNRLLRYDYDIDVQQELKGYYIINNTLLVATSVETGLRNFIDDDFKRFSVSINDDLYNRNSVESKADNEKVTNFVTSEIYGQMEDDGLSITLGNSINDDCPIVRLKTMFPDNHYSLPALDENGSSNWPERFSNEYWQLKQASMPYDVWMGEYMDEPVKLGHTFDPDWFRFISVIQDRVIATISAADPAYGQSPSACFKSIATGSLLKDNNGYIVVLEDIYLRRENYIDFFNYAHALKSRFPKWKLLYFENDFSQWAFAAPYYEQWQRENKATIPMTLHNAKEMKTEFRGADKDSRILNLVFPHQTGAFLYSLKLKGSKDFEIYRNQFLSFEPGTKKKLDGLDAAATMYVKAFEHITTGDKYQSLKDRLFKKQWF